jgi:hypothetical protein
MIAILTRRFILIGLIFALLAGGMAYVVGKESRHSRTWVAGQTIPCATGHNPLCLTPNHR